VSTVDSRSRLVGVQIQSPLFLHDSTGVDEPMSSVWSEFKPSSADSVAARHMGIGIRY
jgi:hypothetical protein